MVWRGVIFSPFAKGVLMASRLPRAPLTLPYEWTVPRRGMPEPLARSKRHTPLSASHLATSRSVPSWPPQSDACECCASVRLAAIADDATDMIRAGVRCLGGADVRTSV